MSRESDLVKSTLILSIGTFLPKLASFAILPILTGFLSTKEYGIYDLVAVLVSLFLPAITLQIQTAAFRFLIDERDDEEGKVRVISSIFAFLIPVSITALAISFYFLNGISFGLRLAICAYFFIDIIVSAAMQCARGLGNSASYSIAAVIASVCQLIGVVVMVLFLHLALDGAIWALFLANVASFVYLIVGTKFYRYIRISAVSRTELVAMLQYSWPMVPNSMSMWAMRLSNRLVITMMMGVTANAVFAVAYKIPQMLTIAQSTFTMAWQENASIAVDDEDAEEYYSKMLNLVFRFLAGAMAIILGLCPILFSVLVRGDYESAYAQIPLLLMGMLFYGLSAYLGGIYVAQKRTMSVGITTIVSAIINVTLDFALIPSIGLYAASIALVISYIILFCFRLYDLNKLLRIKLSKRCMYISIGVLTVMSFLSPMRRIEIDIPLAFAGFLMFILLNREFLNKFKGVFINKLFQKHRGMGN